MKMNKLAQNRFAMGSLVAIAGEGLVAATHAGAIGAGLALIAGFGTYYLLEDDDMKRVHTVENGEEEDTPTLSVPSRMTPKNQPTWHRLLNGRAPRVSQADIKREMRRVQEQEQERYQGDSGPDAEDELRPPRQFNRQVFSFSEVLRSFSPSVEEIYLATLRDGTPVYTHLKALCHISLAGATDAGKSNIMRMIMAQLCYAGARVLVLNPHWTNYDRDKQEDWTPFLPYLAVNPMETRKYDAIDHYLKQAATEILPRRLELFAHSKPTGKPIFYVLDELPAIVKHCKNVPDYLDSILKEGRKVGMYLMSASQDFLVKTIGGTGAVRDCYRTAYSVGGDDRTTDVLLGTTESDEPLGKGVVLVRNASNDLVKKAQTAYVPLVDNESLYQLLGPSTYEPDDEIEPTTDSLDLSVLSKPSSSSASSAENSSEIPENEEILATTTALLEGWTEEEAMFARWSYARIGSKDKVLASLGKRGAISKLRAELDQVLQGGA